MIPIANGLPDPIRSALVRAAEEWFASPDRPHPSADVLAHWDSLIDEWVRGGYPLLVRKSGVRGLRALHASGRVVVCTDNSPAHWIFASALAGEKPTSAELLTALESGEWPVAFARSRADTDKRPEYLGHLGRSRVGRLLNRGGWKVCHIRGVSDDARGRVDDLALESVIEHSRRFLAPSNMFLVPNSHAGFGELREVVDVFSRALGAGEVSGASSSSRASDR